ncbi:MAG: DUF2889 domain-containing protein [Actinomycetales bacterium]|nr:DUF2889 domain-containing protein [Actinomycetales bacterium]
MCALAVGTAYGVWVVSETHAHNGLPGPLPGSPPRAPTGVRRTTSLDLTRPDGPDGPIEVHGRARDVQTGAGGESEVIDRALLALTVTDGVVTALRCFPQRPAAARLIGRQALVGWRSALWRELNDDVETGSALHLLLDDLPGGMVVGGFTRRRALAASGAMVPQPGRRLDVCAGWAADSRAARVLADTGVPPPPVTPPAPELVPDDDPYAWHTLGALPVWGMSRRRRIDAHVDGDTIGVDAMFRDSYVDGAGHERVLHEYGVVAALELDGTVRSVAPAPRVLPHLECPVAGASAQRLVGMPCSDLRDRVSANLFGPSTCTHLNDLMRSLTDVPALVRRGG